MLARDHSEHKSSSIRFLSTTILFSLIGGYSIFKHGISARYQYLFTGVVWVWVTVLILLLLSLVVELFDIDSFEKSDLFYRLLKWFSAWWFIMSYIVYNILMVLLVNYLR